MQWPKVNLFLENGSVSAIAPLIISASRATDIPAFFSSWFMDRLRAGYCKWHNPFNPSQLQYVSFEKCRVIVLWSKNPGPMIPYLAELSGRNYKYCFHFTINDYEEEGLEPGLPELEQRVATFIKLSELVGKEHIIWRFDPVLVGDQLPISRIVEKWHNLALRLSPYTSRLIFSFLDMYKKTITSLKRMKRGYTTPEDKDKIYFANSLQKLNNSLNSPLKLASCAESINLSGYGIANAHCIDPDIIKSLCGSDEQISALLHKKDNGQRKNCGCIPAKDIGSYNSCGYNCAYCYAKFARIH